ncbi:MAG TPA: AAA family ATPase [Candidatus Xenobia bacterium]
MPDLIVIGGPNGAGKSTWAPWLLRDTLGIVDFVNADTLAAGLSAYHTESVAMRAGRLALQRLHELIRTGQSCAFESTLSGRSLATVVRQATDAGYAFTLAFIWLPSPDLSVARVADRVRRGGHDISEHIIRRRYHRGLRNLHEAYLPLAHRWFVYNSAGHLPEIVAMGRLHETATVHNQTAWRQILEA